MSEEHFNIHASVVYQLGATLITDEIQALIELVKNSYDADATKIRLLVHTKDPMPVDSAFPNASGFIIIDDDGTGMTLEEIRRGWLTISNSLKREIKFHGNLPRDKRTPLGDKGLGRLGAQRLGQNIEIWTRSPGQNVEYHVSFSWNDFSNKELLQDVTVTVREVDPPRRKRGTRIVISDLVTPDFWRGAEAQQNLQIQLAQMISPYAEVQKFKVSVQVDGYEIDLISITQQVRQTAELRYSLDFDGTTLNVKGQTRLGFFRPQNTPSNWHEIAEIDNGARLFDFLSARPNLKNYSLKRSKDSGWFIEFSYTQLFAHIAGIERSDDFTPNPGPFSGEIDGFDLGHIATQQQSALDSSALYRRMVKSLSGIKVFRDGFGIRVAPDWLRLGDQWTGARSYYGLKPQNVMGYIALTARDNANLEETTNRQDFVQNAYYSNFRHILNNWLQFTGRVQEGLRRSWLDYARDKTFPNAPDSSAEGLSQALTDSLSQARTATVPLTTLRTALEKTVSNARRAVQAANTGTSLYAIDEKDRIDLEASVSAFEADAEAVGKTTRRLDEVITNLEVLEQQSHTVRDQVGLLRERIEDTVETVSLGITAESLSHEIYNITDRLAEETRLVRSELKKRNIVIAEVVTYLERVSSSIANLRKQLTHLDPSLKYLREKKDDISLKEFFQDQEEFFEERFAKYGIHTKITSSSPSPFMIRMNRGKLVQIIDNLFLNSEFWLREEARMGRQSECQIDVRLNNPHVEISDNGPGVDTQIEAALFEPFVSMKDRGRGLGLYIVQQLLDTEGCSITLLPTRNKQGRMFRFNIDFTTVLIDASGKHG